MTILLDNTVLSNFSTIQRPELIHLAFIEPVNTTVPVFQEMQKGITIGKIPSCDWGWLARVPLTPVEQEEYIRLANHLGRGEASCLAVAMQRGYKIATDDKDARRLARQLGIPPHGHGRYPCRIGEARAHPYGRRRSPATTIDRQRLPFAV
jgi:predicted nucleic acid-binding protein